MDKFTNLKFVYAPRAIKGDFVERFVESNIGYIVDIGTIRRKTITEEYKNGKLVKKTTEYLVDFIKRDGMKTRENAASCEKGLIFDSYEECKECVAAFNDYIDKQMDKDVFFWGHIDKLKNIVASQQEIAMNAWQSELNK